jgi:5-methylcytosine-specific restriction enzyme A
MGELDHLYSSARWRRMRKLQLQQHPLCKFCFESRGEVTIATVVDHIDPHKGDINKFWLGELQSLCHRCHVSTKQFVELNGYCPHIGLDGWPVDKRHPVYQQRR